MYDKSLISYMFALLIPLCSSLTHAQVQHQSVEILKAKKFIFPLEEANRLQIMECPSHTFGSMKDGLEELKKRITRKPEGSLILSQLCISQQLESVKMYSPYLDVIGINPYVSGTDKEPDAKSLIWPGFDHPLINRIRQMRELAGDTVLLGRIGIGGEESEYITKRSPTFEEVKWWIYAIIGADFKGVIWLGGFDSGGRLRRMAAEIERYANDLGHAKLVSWVKTNERQSISSLCSNNRLFVVLLSADYFPKKYIGGNKKLPLPLDEKSTEVEICLSPPLGMKIETARTLGGRLLPVVKKDHYLLVQCRFHGSAEILIFDIQKQQMKEKNQSSITNSEQKGSLGNDNRKTEKK